MELGTFFWLNLCRMGDYVTMGGRVAIRDHVCIASKVTNDCIIMLSSCLNYFHVPFCRKLLLHECSYFAGVEAYKKY